MLKKYSEGFSGIIKAMGLVFGDIGTSPIYTLTVIFLLLKPTPDNIFGIISLIVWTLFFLVNVEYAWFAMSLAQRGEGGSIVLRSILLPLLKSKTSIIFFSILTFLGISLLIGDGVITPAISILSAVEGITLIPHFHEIPQGFLILIAAIIAIGLFVFQKKGTEKVAKIFGPIMLFWFLTLAILGLTGIMQYPLILKAFNPLYALKFILHHQFATFFILSEVFLCATGGEALYADMGHLGRKEIVRSWYVVFGALVLNYLGQGAFLLMHPETKNILFGLAYHEYTILYIPFLILSITATVIASQAMISGTFSIMYQGMTTRIMPLLKVDYTSDKLKSQIYIGVVNWFLLFFIILIMLVFKKSDNLAAAYGLAVTGSMAITGIMMIAIFYLQKKYVKMTAVFFVTMIDFVFLISNTTKILHGGYWSLIIAIIPLSMILIYISGNKRLYKSFQPMGIDKFLEKYNEQYENRCVIPGTALYFAKDIRRVPPYIIRTMFTNGIIYSENIIVSLNQKDEPYGVTSFFREPHLANGLKIFEIQFGYMEMINIEQILKEAGVDEIVIFYGSEDINTSNFMWKIYATIKRISPNIVQFYKLPADKLYGVITRVEM